MRMLLSKVLLLAWGLWFGGLVMLFTAVTSLFKTFEPATAGTAAAGIFHRFERYQLILGGVCLLCALGLRMLKTGQNAILLLLLGIATAAALAEATLIGPQMQALRQQEQTHGESFKRRHGYSMMIYLGETVILLGAGIALPNRVGQ
ncbi:MAG TPA: DUF4149 domain-containing protein [Tepidisphaeraceae bacterium]|jgi:hypothetical protein